MKSLVVYYSLEGNTKLIADHIAQVTGADVLGLIPEKEIPSSGFRKYVWGGKSVVFKETPKLVNGRVDLSTYERIYLGTPIWASTFAAPLNTFIKENHIENKAIALLPAMRAAGLTSALVNSKKPCPTINLLVK